jgi:hypothetical protein
MNSGGPGKAALAGALGMASMAIAGCGTPGAPQPPSLKLPERVSDLTASRAGNAVTLHWTMPKKTTDHLLIHGPVKVVICRRERPENCQPAGEVDRDPGTESEFADKLPASLTTGHPRQLTYSIELKSQKGRSAGPSNPAVVLAGAVPGAVSGLSAEVRADGVALRWTSSETTAVRLHRKLLSAPAPQKKPKTGPMAAPEEPLLRDLLAEPPAAGQAQGAPGALDRTAHFGEVYEYTAQRIVRVSAEGSGGSNTLELAGEISAPVRVEVVDTFPPAIPQGLAAVLVAEEKTIDLSWEPDSEPDLAGYFVYRSEIGGADGTWSRISGGQPLTTPAYRDAAIVPGHDYRYAVTAIDLTGHESSRSVEMRESVPNS